MIMLKDTYLKASKQLNTKIYAHLDSEGTSGFNTRLLAQIAQSVEQGIENPRVGGSIPPLGTT